MNKKGFIISTPAIIGIVIAVLLFFFGGSLFMWVLGNNALVVAGIVIIAMTLGVGLKSGRLGKYTVPLMVMGFVLIILSQFSFFQNVSILSIVG